MQLGIIFLDTAKRKEPDVCVSLAQSQLSVIGSLTNMSWW